MTINPGVASESETGIVNFRLPISDYFEGHSLSYDSSVGGTSMKVTSKVDPSYVESSVIVVDNDGNEITTSVG